MLLESLRIAQTALAMAVSALAKTGYPHNLAWGTRLIAMKEELAVLEKQIELSKRKQN